MASVTVSPKFQIVIPKEVREQMGLKPGQKLFVLLDGGRIHLVPVRPMMEMRGFVKGIDTRIDREPDREV